MCLLLDTTKSVTENTVRYYLSNFFCCSLLPNSLTFYFKKLSHIYKLLLKNILFKYICTLQELSKSHIIKKKNVNDSGFSIWESDHVFWTFLLSTLCLLTFFIFSFSLFCFLFFTSDQFTSL